MFEHNLEDTISAISTAQGQGGIGIVRLSGPKAVQIAGKIFVGSGKKNARDFKTYTLHYGRIVDNGKVIDEVILSVMRKPRSYTRQDVVEINCHGGAVALTEVLELSLKNGARLAAPGEFTKRAFLNGRIDLAQAEAVIDVICAKTDSALKMSLGQLSGGLSKEINRIRQKLLDVIVVLEAKIDFPEEGIEDNTLKIQNKIALVTSGIAKLLDNASAGKIFREGLQAVICGKPNVGKSSLLNALLKKERSIVTPVAGTTRDTIEELIDIRGVPVKLIDTAGILKPRDLIEQKAVKRSKDYIKRADLLLVLFDGSKKIEAADRKLLSLGSQKALAVINKSDKKIKIDQNRISRSFARVVELSAKTGKNLNRLEDAICEFVFKDKLLQPESPIVSNLRHIQALEHAKTLILNAKGGLKEKLTLELVAQDLKDACGYLDKILGKSFSESLLDRIFADFCIGK